MPTFVEVTGEKLEGGALPRPPTPPQSWIGLRKIPPSRWVFLTEEVWLNQGRISEIVFEVVFYFLQIELLIEMVKFYLKKK